MKTAVLSLLLTLLPAILPIRQEAPRRLALVIGNSNYNNPKDKLVNPLNDAEDMKAVLESLGFRVIDCFDCDYVDMNGQIRVFNKELSKGGYEASLFYYAGHGVRVGGKNYIVPIDASLEGLTEASVDFDCVDVGKELLDVMQRRSDMTNIMVLDACLNNPFSKKRGNASELREWAQQVPPSGTLAAFATEPGNTSDDGSGRNGLYTGYLLKYLQTPGLKLEEVFKYTRVEVEKASKGEQVPWEFNMTKGEFYFKEVDDDPDGDGIPNEYDKCPDVAGIIDYGGCPETETKLADKDQDGVPDDYDQCPDEAGEQAYGGCPKPVLADADEDGIPDQFDNCPNEAGEKRFAGCPKPAVAVSRDVPKNIMEEVKGIYFKMNLVEGSTFTMGCTDEQGNDCGSSESPAHEVRVGTFYMAEHEVTQELYEAVMGENPSEFNKTFKKCPKCPVENVSWNDAKSFIEKLNALTNANYRLPTEAEWEFAARGGAEGTATKYAGSGNVEEVAWYGYKNAGKETHPVGEKKANELGLYDMSGNVWEWCEDWYYSDYYSSSPSNNPKGASNGQYRVLRGGSWNYFAYLTRVSYRGRSSPDYRNYNYGFRLVCLR